jgi:SAM-dependent methyltransferase
MSAMPFPDASFSLVFAFMSLQDVDDLDRAVAECARVLRPDGTFVCAVVHPINSAGAFEGEEVPQPFVLCRNYFETSRYADRIEREGYAMTFHCEHRSLERYVRAFEAAGLLLEALREPVASEPEPQSEKTIRWQRVPLFLHLRARRR